MKNSRQTDYDVYLSFGQGDALLAEVAQVEHCLIEAGLHVFNPQSLAPAEPFADRMREELSACLAVVIVLGNQRRLPSTVAVEAGGAWAWNKPIYALVSDKHMVEPGDFPSALMIRSINEIDSVTNEIRRMTRPLTLEQRASLAEAYTAVGIPTDQLTRHPKAITELAQRFNRATRTRWSGDRLLRELLVMRKGGRLPRLGRKNHFAH